MNKILSILLLILLLISLSNYSYGIIEEKKLNSSIEQIINLIIKSDFEKLFDKFYLPPNYSNKEIQNDKEAITKGLRFLIKDQLGSFSNYEAIDKVYEKGFLLNLSTGTKEILKNLSEKKFWFRVKYNDFGNGFLFFAIHIEKKIILIKKIGALLPISNDKTLEIKKNFKQFMRQIAINQSLK